VSVSDLTSDAVVINYVIRAHIFPEMVFHGGIGVRNGYSFVFVIAGHVA
jgi:ribosomal protein S19